MNGTSAAVAALKRMLVGKAASIRILDHTDIREILRGRIVRVFDETSFYFPAKRTKHCPFALLVILERPLSVSPGPDLPVRGFKYALLVAWEYDELVALASAKSIAERFSIHFYLLEEDKLARIHVSPERDDLDVRWTYGISKEVEVGLE